MFLGVGFPESISKIEAGSNVTFSPPPYYIPALVPNINAYGLFLVEYYAQLKIGRSKSGILCSMRVCFIGRELFVNIHFLDSN